MFKTFKRNFSNVNVAELEMSELTFDDVSKIFETVDDDKITLEQALVKLSDISQLYYLAENTSSEEILTSLSDENDALTFDDVNLDIVNAMLIKSGSCPLFVGDVFYSAQDLEHDKDYISKAWQEFLKYHA